MRPALPIRTFGFTLLVSLISLSIAYAIAGGGVLAQKDAHTESSMRYNTEGEVVKVETDYDGQGRIIEEREFYSSGNLRKRMSRAYPKGFKKPNTSTTEYGSDGKTITSTTNDDFDKDGNPTSTVTTNYDAKGTETGGSKRERDPKTGQDVCYNWNAAKQTYDKVDCPKPIISEELFRRLAPPARKPNVELTPGLQKVNLDTSNGRIVVNLPNDIMAGDTISGTVIAEPKGQTQEERAQNAAGLEGVVIDFRAGESFKRLTLRAGYNSEKASGGVSEIFSLPLPRMTFQPIDPPCLMLSDPRGNPIGLVPLQITIPPAGFVEYHKPFIIPPLGQTGRPIVITGPFDGNFDNTKLTIGGQPMTPLAESPRQVVVQSPSNLTGPAEISVKEGNKETKGTFRSVGVNLTAPKTSLKKGESTELHVEVQGLQGIAEPVPLHLTKGGVVTMQGGDSQSMSIKPSEVQSNGIYTTTRTITGVQAGVWTATATVVVFDFCLQDDNNGNTLIFSSETGDYRFCSFAPGLNIAMASIDTVGGGNLADPHLDTGHYDDLTMNKSVITFEHNNGDRRVLINLSSGSFPPSATATVQTTNPKRTFTITDRDTRNNTCVCK